MSQNSKTWEINGLSLTLDLTDADVMERYEDALETMQKEENSIPVDGRASERIRAGCNMFRKLFDRVFGDGTAEKIFAGMPTSLDVYVGVYDNFVDFVSVQLNESNKYLTDHISKYTPNRAQKRAAAKHKPRKK